MPSLAIVDVKIAGVRGARMLSVRPCSAMAMSPSGPMLTCAGPVPPAAGRRQRVHAAIDRNERAVDVAECGDVATATAVEHVD